MWKAGDGGASVIWMRRSCRLEPIQTNNLAGQLLRTSTLLPWQVARKAFRDAALRSAVVVFLPEKSVGVV